MAFLCPKGQKGSVRITAGQSNGQDRLGFPQPLHSGAASSQLFISYSQSSFRLHKSHILFYRYFVLSAAGRAVLHTNYLLCCVQGAQISTLHQQQHLCKDQWIDTTYAMLTDLYLCQGLFYGVTLNIGITQNRT